MQSTDGEAPEPAPTPPEAGATVVATFKGGRREASVDANGCLHLDDGSVHTKPSGAARKVTGYETNGWNFWRVEVEGRVVSLNTLR